MNIVYLLLGVNLGARHEQLRKAAAEIGEHVGVIIERSSIYETAAWGMEDEPSYLNQVLLIETKLKPQLLLAKIHEIESRLGRTRLKKWGSRLIDIDILFYNDFVIEEEFLTIPHPLLHKRKFTLLPLSELTLALMHPVLKKTIQELLDELNDPLEVRRLSGLDSLTDSN